MKEKSWEAFRYIFPKTVPVMVGYLFLGMAYGILMKVEGYGFWWVFAISLFVYAGSLQYVGISLLAARVSPVTALLMALMINARHLFYGISMLGPYRNIKKWKPYLIFALTDETFSVVCNEHVPEDLDKPLVYLWASLLDHVYWVTGSVVGSLLGSVISFNTKGLDFALTALFTVIFTDQWREKGGRPFALAGVAASVACLLIFGADSFIIPAMVLILAIMTFGYNRKGAAGCE